MTRTLSEHESKALLAEHGVPVVVEHVVSDVAGAVAAADALGFPVVAKLTGDGIAHKTERGLVRLGLGSADAVATAAEELLRGARPEDGDVAVLVAPMVQGIRELIVGIHRDPQFGPCVMLGLGGVLAEAVSDVSFRLAPIEAIDADEMLGDLTAQALLGPVRGEAAVDRVAMTEILLGLSSLAITRDDVVSVDVNPLLIRNDGQPLAVDALVELA